MISKCRLPRLRDRVFDAALPGEGGCAEAAGLEGVERLLLVLGRVAGASDAVGLHNGGRGLLDDE